jgi:hypothetical protein
MREILVFPFAESVASHINGGPELHRIIIVEPSYLFAGRCIQQRRADPIPACIDCLADDIGLQVRDSFQIGGQNGRTQAARLARSASISVRLRSTVDVMV